MTATPLREAALAAVAARLAAALPDVVVERARRSAVDLDTEVLPRLVVTGGAMTPDDTTDSVSIHYGIEFAVTGFVAGDTDLAAEQAGSTLHARVVSALVAWMPDAAGIADPAEVSAAFELFDVEEAARPSGSFTATFRVSAVAPYGHPWTS